MERNYRLVVFDWDGTLLDSAGAIVASIQAAARDLGLAPPDEKTARQVIGLGLHDALSQAMPGVPAGDYPRVAERYRHHYLAQDHELSLFAGARELVEELADAGYLLGWLLSSTVPCFSSVALCAMTRLASRPVRKRTRSHLWTPRSASGPKPLMLLLKNQADVFDQPSGPGWAKVVWMW